MIKQQNVSLNGTAIELTNTLEVEGKCTISIQNTSTDKYAYIGNSSVTTSVYGFRIHPSQSIAIELAPYEKLYGVGDTGATIAVLVVEN